MASLLDNLICALQTCRRKKDLPRAKQLHAYLRKHQLDTHTVLGNYLVPALVECGSLPDAHRVLERLPRRNEHSWSSVILGHIERGDVRHAFLLYDRMREDYICASNHTFLALLRACALLKAVDRGRCIHVEITEKGYETDPFLANTLVDMYGKCGLFAEASCVFDRLLVRDTVSWTALIAGYAEHGLGDEALCCLERMQLQGSSPDAIAIVWSLKACGLARAIDKGKLLCADVVRRGWEKDVFVGSTIVDMYAKCSALADAQKVFDCLTIQNIVSWTALIGGYAENGLSIEAYECFEKMKKEGVAPNSNTFVSILKACITRQALERGHHIHTEIAKGGLERNPYVGNTLVDMYTKCGSMAEAGKVFTRLPAHDAVSWGALISGYAEHGLNAEVLNCFDQMQVEGVPLDANMFVHCLKACGTIGALETGRNIHAAIRKTRLERDLFVGNTLIDMYGRCGSLVEGREAFGDLLIRDVVSWNAMIKAYGVNSKSNMAIRCFEDMQEENVKPDGITFMCLLVACSHACMIDKGLEFFKLMRDKYAIEPSLEHCTCVVDLLARSGHVHEAEKFAEATHCLPSITALLSACKNYGKTETGLRCFEQLAQLIPEDAASYLLMSDIYASAGRWNDASKVDELRECTGAQKRPASALIEVNKEMLEFNVGDKLSDEMSAMSEVLSSHMKYGGYVPNLELLSRRVLEEMGVKSSEHVEQYATGWS